MPKVDSLEYHLSFLMEGIAGHLPDRPRFTPTKTGQSGAYVYKSNLANGRGCYLKFFFNKDKADFDYEVAVTRWLGDRFTVGNIIETGEKDRFKIILFEELPGSDAATTNAFTPIEIVRLAGETLAKLHALKIQDCRFEFKLEKKIQKAKGNVKFLKKDLFPEKYKNLETDSLIKILEEMKPISSEDLVFTHGDFCLPNVVLNVGSPPGLIDLGRAGVADRYVDLSLASESIERNFGKSLWKEFLSGYGIEGNLDQEKIDYYIFLDHFF